MSDAARNAKQQMEQLWEGGKSGAAKTAQKLTDAPPAAPSPVFGVEAAVQANKGKIEAPHMVNWLASIDAAMGEERESYVIYLDAFEIKMFKAVFGAVKFLDLHSKTIKRAVR